MLVREAQPSGHRLGGGQHPRAGQAPPPHLGARCGGWPSAWRICTDAAPTRHLSARLQWQQNSGELPGLRLQALEVAPRCSAPPSAVPLMAPPLMTCPRARSEPSGHLSHPWKQESARCVLPLIAQSVTVVFAANRPGKKYLELSGVGNCLTVHPSQLRLGGKAPQNGSHDGTVGRHPGPGSLGRVRAGVTVTVRCNMESWQLTHRLGQSGSVWSKARRVECGAWMGRCQGLSPSRPLAGLSRAGTLQSGEGACHVGAASFGQVLGLGLGASPRLRSPLPVLRSPSPSCLLPRVPPSGSPPRASSAAASVLPKTQIPIWPVSSGYAVVYRVWQMQV